MVAMAVMAIGMSARRHGERGVKGRSKEGDGFSANRICGLDHHESIGHSTCALLNRPMFSPGQSEMLVSDTLAHMMTAFQYHLERFPILSPLDIIRWLKKVLDSPNQSYNGSDYIKSDTFEI